MKIVVALGGHTLTPLNTAQVLSTNIQKIQNFAESIATMIKNKYQVVITHGNAPQVGSLLLQQKHSYETMSSLSLDRLGAMTQGQIGYQLQHTFNNEFKKQQITKKVATIITQTIVDKDDPEFGFPTKPIGPVYSEEEIQELKKHYKMGNSNGGWRILVPSPEPIEIVESDIIRRLIDNDFLVIAAGGGGIPVIKDNGLLKGVDAVVDKDLASEELAKELDAKILLILTDVENVFIDYGLPSQEKLYKISTSDLNKYYQKGQFPAGSMGPKVRAVLNFIENGGKKAIITSVENALESLLYENTGTIITTD